MRISFFTTFDKEAFKRFWGEGSGFSAFDRNAVSKIPADRLFDLSRDLLSTADISSQTRVEFKNFLGFDEGLSLSEVQEGCAWQVRVHNRRCHTFSVIRQIALGFTILRLIPVLFYFPRPSFRSTALLALFTSTYVSACYQQQQSAKRTGFFWAASIGLSSCVNSDIEASSGNVSGWLHDPTDPLALSYLSVFLPKRCPKSFSEALAKGLAGDAPSAPAGDTPKVDQVDNL